MPRLKRDLLASGLREETDLSIDSSKLRQLLGSHAMKLSPASNLSSRVAWQEEEKVIRQNKKQRAQLEEVRIQRRPHSEFPEIPSLRRDEQAAEISQRYVSIQRPKRR